MIYVVVFTFSPQGQTATEQAGTARLSILLLSQQPFQLVPQTTQNKLYRENDSLLLRGKKGRKNLFCMRLTKVRYMEGNKTTANKTECDKAQG